MNRHLASAANELEADMILTRMAESGIRAWPIDSAGIGRGAGGGRYDVYVEEADIERARKALADAESFTEADLVELSEEAGDDSGAPGQAPG